MSSKKEWKRHEGKKGGVSERTHGSDWMTSDGTTSLLIVAADAGAGAGESSPLTGCLVEYTVRSEIEQAWTFYLGRAFGCSERADDESTN